MVMIENLKKRGFIEAHGQMLNKSEYPELYSAFVNSSVDFSETETEFRIPDFRPRSSVTVGEMATQYLYMIKAKYSD